MILVLLDPTVPPSHECRFLLTPVTISAQPRSCNGRCSSWCQRRWSKSGSAAGINFKAGHEKPPRGRIDPIRVVVQYVVVPGYDCGIWLWDMIVGYDCGIWLWDMIVGYDCGIWLWDMVVGYDCGIWLWDMIVGYDCGIWLWDMIVGYGCGIWLWDMVVGYDCGI